MIAPRSPTKSPGMNRRAVACHPTVKQLEKGTLSALRTGFGMAFVSLYLGYKLIKVFGNSLVRRVQRLGNTSARTYPKGDRSN
jgi:hypothetical protein